MCLALAGAVLSPSPLPIIVSALALVAIVLLLWRRTEPPILLLPPLFQWSEVSMPAISTMWLGVPLNDLADRAPELETATYYGLAAGVMLSIGFRLALDFGKRRFRLRGLLAEAQALPFTAVASAAFGLMIAGYVFATASVFAGPARELFNSIAALKSAGLFILAYWCLARRQNLPILAAVVGADVLYGMTGFFADFKNSILTLLIAAIIARPRLGRGSVMAAGAAAGLILLVAIFWSAVKTDYRVMVNQGSGAQVILVPLEERADYILKAMGEFGPDDLSRGFNALVARHGYVEYLAQTMSYIPASAPHENGAITLSAIRHITQPRIFFPNKPPLPSDTEVMARYTGQQNVWDANTSISIGHVGEIYVDFGFWGGLVAMMMLGGLIGFFVRTIADAQRTPDLLKAGLCIVAILPLAYFGNAYVKLIGTTTFCAIITFGLLR
ncbi:MAG: hypothetical protein ACOYMK_17950, partial [Hyphomonadaceae bacterium]